MTREDILHHLETPRSLTAGYTKLTGVCPPPSVGDQNYTADSDNYRRNVTYLEKLQALCKENGAEVLVAGSAYFKAEDKAAFVKTIQK